MARSRAAGRINLNGTSNGWCGLCSCCRFKTRRFSEKSQPKLLVFDHAVKRHGWDPKGTPFVKEI